SEIVYMRVYDSTTKCLYYATLTIKLPGCTLSASFTDSVDNLKVKFFGKANVSHHLNIKWFFGDGTTDSTSGFNATHTYASGTTSVNAYLRVLDSSTKCLTYYSVTIYFSYCI